VNEVGYRDVVFDMLLVVHTIQLAGALRPPEAYPGCAHFHFDHHLAVCHGVCMQPGDLSSSSSFYPCPMADTLCLLNSVAGLLHSQLPAGGRRSEPSGARAPCAQHTPEVPTTACGHQLASHSGRTLAIGPEDQLRSETARSARVGQFRPHRERP